MVNNYSYFKIVSFIMMLGVLIQCNEDNPSNENYSVSIEGRDVEFELYTPYNNIQPLETLLQSDSEINVMYSWFRLDSSKVNEPIITKRVSGAGSLLLNYSFTEEQFRKDFPSNSVLPQKYICEAIISRDGYDGTQCFFDTITVKPTLPNGIAILLVNTIDGDEPTCEYVEAPPEGVSHSIRNATKVPGRVKVIKEDVTLFDSGDYNKDVSGMTIKLRGNSSPYFDKKPFKIKLQKKADMLCRGEEYADKNWVLLKDGDDCINAFIGFKTNQYFQLQWTPSFQYVNLVFNNEYRGVYMLVESVERNPKCRLNVDKKTGFIVEYDAYWWNEDLCFNSSINQLFKFTFKYPDSDDLTPERYESIRSSVNNMEDYIIAGGNLSNVIDINSFASWVLAQDILGNMDGWGSNIFMTKFDDSASSKFLMGNMWDFDDILQAQNRYSSCHNKFYFERFFMEQSFRDEYISLWSKAKLDYISYIQSCFSELLNNHGDAINKSRILDAIRWNKEPHNLVDDIEKALGYFVKRIEWLDNHNFE